MSSASKSEPARPRPLAGRRILIVEDEYFLADDLRRGFDDLGADVVGPIAHLNEAEALLKSGTTVDGALLDINIRSEMIFSFARALQSRNVPFVFTTGYDRKSLEQEFAGVQIWEKPLDISRVASALIALMGTETVARS